MYAQPDKQREREMVKVRSQRFRFVSEKSNQGVEAALWLVKERKDLE
jgi:hypothetical protein